MMLATMRHKLTLSAKVTRADGTVVNLGRIDGPFPWRAWLYRLRIKLESMRR